MSEDLSQYKDLYLETAKGYLQSLNNSLLILEKNPNEHEAIEEIFRSAHSLKSQSAAMGYEKTGFLCHAVEDVFFEIKENRMKVSPELADVLFAAFDSLKKSIDHIESENSEIDVSSQVEILKKMTGIKTEGSGKSIRNDATSVPTPPTPSQTLEEKKEVQIKEVQSSQVPISNGSLIKTIPVKVEQLDEMMNLLEELLVYRLRLKKLVKELKSDELRSYQDQSDKITEALWFQIMKARAVPVKMVFDHFPRAVRDLAREENKQIELTMTGGDLEIDRTIVDRLDEPLIHLIRNAVSHGIEKSGTIKLVARREKEYAVVEVIDDGMGIDWDAVKAKSKTDEKDLKKVLFSGISTSEKVTQVSGRGVGLGVVKKNVEEFGGSIDVASQKGKGTTFTLRFPLSLAVTKTLIVQVGSERYAIPVGSVDRSLQINTTDLRKTADQDVFVLEGGEIPLLYLADKFGVEKKELKNQLLVIIVWINDERVGLVADEIIEVSQMIIKPVPEIMKGNKAFAGTAILGDGQATLLINPQGLL